LVPVHAYNVNGHRILTNREEQIVSLVATGLTNREIARELDLSDHTVKNYLFQIYEKLGISNRVELALYSRHSAELRDETAGPSDRPAASSSSSSTPEDRVVSLLKAGSA
jgi:DNA-binding CsgD family transcriptional regulator